MDNLLYYKQARNSNGNIHLIVYIDWKQLSIKNILDIKINLLVPLYLNKGLNKNLVLMGKMLYDLDRTPHLYTVKFFILNQLHSENIQVKASLIKKNPVSNHN